MKKNNKYFFVIIFVFMVLLFYSCNFETEPERPNNFPETTIANIPVTNDTLFSLVKLQWDGGDDDGFVAGYEYRYHTRYVTLNDSVFRSEWTFIEEQSITLAFDSKDIINYQNFEVRSVDNDGAVDPTPASIKFYTKQAIAPVAQILTPKDESELFALEVVTDWWNGIKIDFNAEDKDGEVVEYAWAVDNGEWNWTNDTTVFISPRYFQPLEGEHSIKVIAKDNTNIDSNEPAVIKVKLIRPTFEKDILIIDETFEKEFPAGHRVDDSVVDQFYGDIFNTTDNDDWWDYSENELIKKPLPPKEKLGRYKLVVWHSDHRAGGSGMWHNVAANENYLKDYLNTGGKLILGGWRVIRSFVGEGSPPHEFPDTSFAGKYLHIKKMNEPTLQLGNFIGAITTGNPFTRDTIKIDQAKLDGDFRLGGKLSDANIISQRGAFTETLYTYYGEPGNDSFVQYYGLPVATIYRGTSFKVVVLGFPLYFLEKESAEKAASYILNQLEN